MKKLIVTIAMLAGIQAQALTVLPNPFVQAGGQEYKTVQIQVYQADLVEVVVTKEFKHGDCNTKSIIGEPVLVSGDGDGFYDKYMFDAAILSTEIYCPIVTPAFETLRSEPMVFKTFTNPNVDGELQISFVIPKDFNIEAKIIR